MTATPFNGLTKVTAGGLCFDLSTNAHRIPALIMQGTWCARRFVIAKLSVSNQSVAEPVPDFERLTLTIPNTIDPDSLMRETQRFGASVASQFRRRNPEFERIVSDDGVRHWCQKLHHVALCGSKGPWGLCEGIDLAVSGSCPSCAEIASSTPSYRRRLPSLTDAC